jgi:hypothetical protein
LGAVMWVRVSRSKSMGRMRVQVEKVRPNWTDYQRLTGWQLC